MRFAWVETIHKPREHRRRPTEHFLAMLNSAGRNESFRDCRIQAGGAFDCRAPRVIEKFRSLTSPPFSVSLCGVLQGRKAGPIELALFHRTRTRLWNVAEGTNRADRVKLDSAEKLLLTKFANRSLWLQSLKIEFEFEFEGKGKGRFYLWDSPGSKQMTTSCFTPQNAESRASHLRFLERKRFSPRNLS
jgi:hypothetical protein